MTPSQDAADSLFVACLCAAWCRTCDDYRGTFDALAREFAAQTRFVWVDIEDDEEALGTVDVADFPTLLIARGEEIRFFGPVTPHVQAARQLVQRALHDQLGTVLDAALAGLPARLRRLRRAGGPA
jgi:thiol-disulfide isomerase/thioredoxin